MNLSTQELTNITIQLLHTLQHFVFIAWSSGCFKKKVCLNNRNRYLFLLNLQNMPKSYASFFLLRKCLKWTIQLLSIVIDSYLISWHYLSLWQTRPNFKYNNTTTTLYLTYNVIKTQLSYFLYRYDCYCIKNIIITYNTCLY